MQVISATSSMPTQFGDTFDADGRLWLPASAPLRERVEVMRAQPATAPRSRDHIAAARIGFDTMVANALRATEIDASQPPQGIRTGSIDTDGVRLVFAEPEGAVRGAVLHIHGGGWCIGSAQSLLPALVALAQRTQTAVASVEYRLAPEAPHPAALEDCERAAHWWLRDLAQRRGITSERMVIAGESAGAHLALLTLLRLRTQGVRLSGAALTYGLFDLTNTRSSRHLADGANLVIDAEACDFYVGMLLGEGVSPDPAMSPLQLPSQHFFDLPPALYCVGTLDPLHDDSIEMHQRWQQAGNRSWLAIYEHAPHAFDLLQIPESRHLQDLRAAFIRHCLPPV